MRSGRFAAIAIVLLVVALAVDGLAWQHLVNERVYEEDWGRLLRVMGFVPTWLIAALALWLVQRPGGRAGAPEVAAVTRSARHQSLYLVASVLLSGIVGEVLKLVFRRRRPGDPFELYDFRPWTDRPLHNGGLSMPSTHAVVAFGAAAALTKLFPRAWPVWWGLAVGCGLTRVLARAHYVSDVVAAALIAVVVGGGLAKRMAIGRSGVSA